MKIDHRLTKLWAKRVCAKTFDEHVYNASSASWQILSPTVGDLETVQLPQSKLAGWLADVRPDSSAIDLSARCSHRQPQDQGQHARHFNAFCRTDDFMSIFMSSFPLKLDSWHKFNCLTMDCRIIRLKTSWVRLWSIKWIQVKIETI